VAPVAPTEPTPVAPAPVDTAPMAAAPVTPPAEPPPPVEEPASDIKITTGAAVRAGLRLQNPNDIEKMNDQYLDEISAELRFFGKVTEHIGWTANVAGDGRTQSVNGVGPAAFDVRVLDAIAQLDAMPEFHVWLGRMLTPTDRSNFSGPWFLNAWNYPGIYAPGLYIGPRGTEEAGRETGAVIWGDINEGQFKYYAGVMDLDANIGNTNFASQSPLYTLRAQYAIMGKEPGFYGSSTYYGAQDIVAIGAAFQYQKDFVIGPSGPGEVKDDITAFNADALAEFNTGAGTVTGELAFYHADSDVMPYQNFWFINASYLTPDNVGIGKIQPQVRFQQTTLNDPDDTSISAFEVGVHYIIKDYFAKMSLTYTRGLGETPATVTTDGDVVEGGDFKSNMIQLGFQVQQ
jgi:hypothetical protein